jgi:hypothetical protein
MTTEYNYNMDAPLGKALQNICQIMYDLSKCQINKDISEPLVKKWIEEIYEIGFKDGQMVYQKLRSGDFDSWEPTEYGKSIGLTEDDCPIKKSDIGYITMTSNSEGSFIEFDSKGKPKSNTNQDKNA